MSALEFAVILRRRWYFLALATLFTLLGLWMVHTRPVRYQGCEGMFLSGAPWAGNVYLDSNLSLAMVTGMVTQTMTSQPMQRRFEAVHVTDYQVTQTNTGEVRFPAYDEPTLQVCATSATAQGTAAAIRQVTSKLRSVLYQMQAAQHVPAGSFITAVQLTRPLPAPITGRPSLAYIGVLLIGVVGAVPLTVWSDRLLAGLLPSPKGVKNGFR